MDTTETVEMMTIAKMIKMTKRKMRRKIKMEMQTTMVKINVNRMNTMSMRKRRLSTVSVDTLSSILAR